MQKHSCGRWPNASGLRIGRLAILPSSITPPPASVKPLEKAMEPCPNKLLEQVSDGSRVVDTRHEATGLFAADVTARLTGRPGVAANDERAGVLHKHRAGRRLEYPIVDGPLAHQAAGRGGGDGSIKHGKTEAWMATPPAVREWLLRRGAWQCNRRLGGFPLRQLRVSSDRCWESGGMHLSICLVYSFHFETAGV